MKPTRFPDGSGVPNSREQSACVRAIDAYMSLIRKADRLGIELDDVTIPGVVRAPMADDDSLVIALRAAIDVVPPTEIAGGPVKNRK
jgi:hypothetical protein